jgi:hypothetical protein
VLSFTARTTIERKVGENDSGKRPSAREFNFPALRGFWTLS